MAPHLSAVDDLQWMLVWDPAVYARYRSMRRATEALLSRVQALEILRQARDRGSRLAPLVAELGEQLSRYEIIRAAGTAGDLVRKSEGEGGTGLAPVAAATRKLVENLQAARKTYAEATGCPRSRERSSSSTSETSRGG